MERFVSAGWIFDFGAAVLAATFCGFPNTATTVRAAEPVQHSTPGQLVDAFKASAENSNSASEQTTPKK